MYKILLVKQGFPQGTYEFYKKLVTTIDTETDTEITSLVPFETDDLAQLAEKCTELMETHPMNDIIPVEALSLDVLVTIQDTTIETENEGI